MFARASVSILMLALLGLNIARADDTWVLRENGIGPAKIGMTLAQLNTALHERFKLPDYKEDQGCFEVESRSHAQVSFMIEYGKLARVDVIERGIATTEGIQAGDSEERAVQAYGGSLKVEPNFYNPEEGHYLTIRSSDGKYGIRFETDKGKITTFYGGTFEAIQYVEGCE